MDENGADRRKRDASATRASILTIARRRFAEKGYDAVGLRELAAEAGVDAAMVNRYFGSKEALFDEAVIETASLETLLDGPRAGFGARAAAHVIAKDVGAIEEDPTLAIIRSMGSQQVGPRLCAAVRDGHIRGLAGWLGGRDAEQRAALILSIMLGFDLMRRVAKTEALAVDAPALRARFAAALQTLVDEG